MVSNRQFHFRLLSVWAIFVVLFISSVYLTVCVSHWFFIPSVSLYIGHTMLSKMYEVVYNNSAQVLKKI